MNGNTVQLVQVIKQNFASLRKGRGINHHAVLIRAGKHHIIGKNRLSFSRHITAVFCFLKISRQNRCFLRDGIFQHILASVAEITEFADTQSAEFVFSVFQISGKSFLQTGIQTTLFEIAV